MKGYKIVFVSQPSEAADNVNALALGVLSGIPDLASKLHAELEGAEILIRTKSGIASVRLERDIS